MNNIQIVNPLDIPDWDAHILKFPEATIFHSAAWARVLIESYGFEPHYCVVYQGEEITGVLPLMGVRDIFGRKKGVSLPFTDFCEPLCTSQTEWDALLQASLSLLKKNRWNMLELRGGQQFLNTAPKWSRCFTHTLDLNKTEDELFSACRESTRRNIKKAIKQSLNVTHETTTQALHNFYRLNVLTRREHGLPPQPLSFFKNLFDSVVAKGQGFISVVRQKNQAIAADLFLINGEKAIYKYGASDRKFQHLRPNNLLIWEGMLHCKASGAKSLNLGRTETHHDGLLQFKRGLGCLEEKVDYFRYGGTAKSFQQGNNRHGEGFSTKVLRHLPLFTLRMIGKLAYKYVG
jgi:hypothetical protein